MHITRSFPRLELIHTVVFDFDGVFTDNKVWVSREGVESVRCDRGDGLAFDFVRAWQKKGWLDAEYFILSKESDPLVQARADKLKLQCYQGVGDKLGFVEDYLTRRLPDEEDAFAGLVYLGNDLNDVPLLRRAGFSVAPADAHEVVRGIADVVMDQKGGEGFVRAFVEQLLGIHKMGEEEIDELVLNS